MEDRSKKIDRQGFSRWRIPLLAVILSIMTAALAFSAFAEKESDESKEDSDRKAVKNELNPRSNPMSKKIEMTDEQWKEILTPEQYRILREKGTEKAFSGEYYECKESGVYRCAACGQPLFDSSDKYDSGSGWPSYTKPLKDDSVAHEKDQSLFMNRTEVLCERCGSHLGHVFDDGPDPTGKRYCINSAALELQKKDTKEEKTKGKSPGK